MKEETPQTATATVQGKLVCEHGHNMHVEGTGKDATAVCYTQACPLYRVRYAVEYPTALLTKKDDAII